MCLDPLFIIFILHVILLFHIPLLVSSASGKRDCTPDELASLCKEIQDSPLVKTHTYHLISYKNSFVGKELVEWLVRRKSMSECN